MAIRLNLDENSSHSIDPILCTHPICMCLINLRSSCSHCSAEWIRERYQPVRECALPQRQILPRDQGILSESAKELPSIKDRNVPNSSGNYMNCAGRRIGVSLPDLHPAPMNCLVDESPQN